jgi:hypothetical protein
MTEISDTAKVLDTRDIIKRFEALEAERNEVDTPTTQAGFAAWDASAAGDEFRRLEDLLDELRGSVGDYQWRGGWYSGTLIRDDYFETYAQEFAEALQQDYMMVDFGKSTYWYR